MWDCHVALTTPQHWGQLFQRQCHFLWSHSFRGHQSQLFFTTHTQSSCDCSVCFSVDLGIMQRRVWCFYKMALEAAFWVQLVTPEAGPVLLSSLAKNWQSTHEKIRSVFYMTTRRLSSKKRAVLRRSAEIIFGHFKKFENFHVEFHSQPILICRRGGGTQHGQKMKNAQNVLK